MGGGRCGSSYVDEMVTADRGRARAPRHSDPARGRPPLRRPPRGPPPDLLNGRAIIQDNLWSTPTHQYAVWVATDGTPYAGRRRAGQLRLEDGEPGEAARKPACGADRRRRAQRVRDRGRLRGGIHVSGNMHNDPLHYVSSPGGDLDHWRGEPTPANWSSVTYPAFVGCLMAPCCSGGVRASRVTARSWSTPSIRARPAGGPGKGDRRPPER